MIKIIITHPVTRLGLTLETQVEDDEMVETVKRLFKLLEPSKGPHTEDADDEPYFIV